MNKQIIEDVKEIADKNKVSLHVIKTLVSQEIKKEAEERDSKKINQNKDLVGKCFIRDRGTSLESPTMKKYFKVISERSINKYSVECLTFSEHPYYHFTSNAQSTSVPGDHYGGSFDFRSFETESVPVKSIQQLREISKEEYEEVAKKYLETLLIADFQI